MTVMRDRAETLLADADSIGCQPVVEGDALMWHPPLPVELAIRAMPLASEIAVILAESEDV